MRRTFLNFNPHIFPWEAWGRARAHTHAHIYHRFCHILCCLCYFGRRPVLTRQQIITFIVDKWNEIKLPCDRIVAHCIHAYRYSTFYGEPLTVHGIDFVHTRAYITGDPNARTLYETSRINYGKKKIVPSSRGVFDESNGVVMDPYAPCPSAAIVRPWSADRDGVRGAGDRVSSDGTDDVAMRTRSDERDGASSRKNARRAGALSVRILCCAGHTTE